MVNYRLISLALTTSGDAINALKAASCGVDVFFSFFLLTLSPL